MLILILQLVKRLSPCHQPHVTDFRELLREEAQETKEPDLGCFSKDDGDQGSAQLCSVLLCSAPFSSCVLSTAFPSASMWLVGWFVYLFIYLFIYLFSELEAN